MGGERRGEGKWGESGGRVSWGESERGGGASGEHSGDEGRVRCFWDAAREGRQEVAADAAISNPASSVGSPESSQGWWVERLSRRLTCVRMSSN